MEEQYKALIKDLFQWIEDEHLGAGDYAKDQAIEDYPQLKEFIESIEVKSF